MKYMLAVLFVLSLLVPTFSQDITPTQEKPVATVEATVEAVPTVAAGGVTIINNPADSLVVAPAEVPAAPEPWFAKYVAGLLALLLLASTFLGTVNKIIEAKAKDVNFVTGAEIAAKYVPQLGKDYAKSFVNDLIAVGENLQAFLDEATDGTPYVVKVHTPTPPAVLPHDPTSPEA